MQSALKDYSFRYMHVLSVRHAHMKTVLIGRGSIGNNYSCRFLRLNAHKFSSIIINTIIYVLSDSSS